LGNLLVGVLVQKAHLLYELAQTTLLLLVPVAQGAHLLLLQQITEWPHLSLQFHLLVEVVVDTTQAVQVVLVVLVVVVVLWLEQQELELQIRGSMVVLVEAHTEEMVVVQVEPHKLQTLV
jgi:hypothetical protein